MMRAKQNSFAMWCGAQIEAGVFGVPPRIGSNIAREAEKNLRYMQQPKVARGDDVV